MKLIAKTQKSPTVHILIMQLSILLDDWEQDAKILAFLTFYYDQGQESANEGLKSKENPLYILAMCMQKANTASLIKFSSLSQFVVEKPKTYKQAINGPHAQ